MITIGPKCNVVTWIGLFLAIGFALGMVYAVLEEIFHRNK